MFDHDDARCVGHVLGTLDDGLDAGRKSPDQTASRHQLTHTCQWYRYGVQNPSSRMHAAMITVPMPNMLNSSERRNSIAYALPTRA